jgi:hypothetical protein
MFFCGRRDGGLRELCDLETQWPGLELRLESQSLNPRHWVSHLILAARCQSSIQWAFIYYTLTPLAHHLFIYLTSNTGGWTRSLCLIGKRSTTWATPQSSTPSFRCRLWLLFMYLAGTWAVKLSTDREDKASSSSQSTFRVCSWWCYSLLSKSFFTLPLAWGPVK